MPPADALAALIANDNNLVRVWQFDASMQNEAPDFGWSLYDPRPLFADANTIEMVEGGEFYWINVQNEQTAMLGGTSAHPLRRLEPGNLVDNGPIQGGKRRGRRGAAPQQCGSAPVLSFRS